MNGTSFFAPLFCALFSLAAITACAPGDGTSSITTPLAGTTGPASSTAADPSNIALVPVQGVTEDTPSTRSYDAGVAPQLDSEELSFLGLINQYRASSGLGQLQASITLTNSSRWMSSDMAAKNYFSHTDSLGRNPFTRMKAFNYTYQTYEGENIAAGYSDAQKTFTQWRNSPEHNANMLNGSYKVIGIGRATRSGSSFSWYWTTDFGGTVDTTIQQ